MSMYTTNITAIDPITGMLTTYCGPNIPGISFADAAEYCQQNGLGYCKVIGLLVAEIPTKINGITPDWDNAIDYQTPKLN